MPTDYTTWFQGSDVANVLKSLQVWPVAGDESPDGSDLETLFQEQCDISAAAIPSDIEMKTGRKPFLAKIATIQHSQFGSNGMLQLLAPARSITSISIGGNALEASQYYVYPPESSFTGEPITAISFGPSYGNSWGGGYYNAYPALPNQIAVTGLFGSYEKVPAILYRAGLNMAALLTIATIQGEQDLASISEDGYSIQSDTVGPIDDKVRINFWPAQYEAAWKSYVRVVV